MKGVKLIRLIIDMDEVICDFLGKLCEDYNAQNDTCLSVDRIDHYDLTGFIGQDGRKLFLQAGFFDRLKPFPGALEVIKKLHDEGHEVIVATNALGHPDVAADKCRWMQECLPFLYPDNFFIGVRKELIKGDLIFEDSPGVLKAFPGIKVVMDRAYNKGVEGHRIYNNDWEKFYSLVKELDSHKG